MIQSVLDAPRTEPFPVPLLVCTLKWHCPLALSGIDEPSWDPRTPAHWGPQTKELGGREAMMVSLVRETKLNVDVKNVLSAPIFSRPVPWRGQAGCFHPLSVSCPLFWGEVGWQTSRNPSVRLRTSWLAASAACAWCLWGTPWTRSRSDCRHNHQVCLDSHLCTLGPWTVSGRLL